MKKVLLTLFASSLFTVGAFAGYDDVIDVNGTSQNVEGSAHNYNNCPEGYICDALGNKCQGDSCNLDLNGNLSGDKIELWNGKICINCKITDGLVIGLTGIDTNNDGIPDTNIDTNNDGIPDTNIDTNNDGIPDTNIDTNNDGIPDNSTNPDNSINPDNGTGGTTLTVHTTEVSGKTCPVDYLDFYEKMLLKANLFKLFEDKMTETGDDLKNLFQTGSDVSDFTKIKDDVFAQKMGNIEISTSTNATLYSFFTDGITKSEIDSRNFDKYLKQSPEGDFILHQKYFLTQTGSLQKFVLEKLGNQVTKNDLKKIISGDFLFNKINLTDEEKARLKTTSTELIFKPYVDFLNNKRKIKFKKLIGECKNVEGSDYGEDILCGIDVKRTKVGGSDDTFFNGAAGAVVGGSVGVVTAGAVLGSAAVMGPVGIAVGLTAVYLSGGFDKPKRTEGNVFTPTETVLETMQELGKIDFSSYVFSSIGKYEINASPSDIISGFTGSILDNYTKLINENLKYDLNASQDDKMFTTSDIKRICGDFEISTCREKLIKTFIDENVPMGLNNKTVQLLDVQNIDSKINVQNLVNTISSKYQSLVSNYKFQEYFQGKFNTGITVSNLDGGNITGSSSVVYPDGFLDLIGGVACKTDAGVSQVLSSFVKSSVSSFDKASTEDFLKDSGISDSLGLKDVSLKGIESFIKENSGSTLDIKMESPKLNPNTTSGGGGSCPYLYVKINGKKKLVGFFLIDTMFKERKKDSFEKIKKNFSDNEKISISIAEILPEKLHLDEVKGILVKHKKNREILLDKKGKIFSVNKNFIDNKKKISKSEKDNGEIYLGKINKENLLIFKGGLNRKAFGYQKMMTFLGYGFIAKNFYFGGDLFEKIFYGLVDNKYVLPKFYGFMQKFYGLKFQYKDGDKWVNFEEINTYPQEKRIVKIGKNLFGKELRIKFNTGTNYIENLYLSKDFKENISGEEVSPEKNIGKNIFNKISGTDENMLIIKQGHRLDLDFDLQNSKLKNNKLKDDEEMTFYLKTNGYFRYLEK